MKRTRGPETGPRWTRTISACDAAQYMIDAKERGDSIEEISDALGMPVKYLKPIFQNIRPKTARVTK
jgi:hypothetical protein